MPKPSSPSLRVWLALAAIATGLAYFAAYHSIHQSTLSTAGVNQTQRTLAALIAFEGSLSDFVFAPDDAALARASVEVFRRVDELAVQTADSEGQQVRVARARREVDDLLRLRQDATAAATRMPAEVVIRQNLSRTVRELRAEELRLLTERVATAQGTSRQLTRTLFVLGAGSAVLLGWVLGLAVRDERRRRQNEAALRAANQDLDARVAARTAELHDALERERALRSEAESSNRLKDEFLMTVSHELRTPLNALLGWAGILRTGTPTDDLRLRAVTAIHENAKLQAQLIEDLLDTARILTAKLRIEPTLVDIGRIVEDAVSVVAPAAEAKDLELDVHIYEPGVVLFGDPMRIRQIVWNLVSNAVKFTSQGRVSVRVFQEATDGHVKIAVADSGVGIAPEFLPHVFERFRQERVGTTRAHRGLGLGLAIVQELVELHGGTVAVASPGVGLGATFTVSLPTKSLLRRLPDGAPKDSGEHQAVDRPAMPALDGTRVLVVDDDPTVHDVVTAALEHCGARVTSARSAADARRVLAREPCDVLLVDIAMPDEDGYALVRRLRADGLTHPVAAFTAHATATDRRLADEAGFDVHIAKPIEAASLARAVATLAGSRRVDAN